MRGRLWLNYFTRIMGSESTTRWKLGDSQWTKFMGDVMEHVGEKMNCFVARRRPENKETSYEYLNIDAVFIDKSEYDLPEERKGWDPFVLPRAVVELENYYDRMKISYCLWKILCVRAPIRVLICYQSNANNVLTLKQHLESIIWQGSLMKGTDGDLFVIIGDGSVKGEASWGKYFSVFEWRNDRLEKIEGLAW